AWSFRSSTVKENSDLLDDEFRRLMQNLYYPKYCFQLASLNKDKGIIEELDVLYMIDNIFSAGTDAVSASLTWIVAALANNPE
ncbi:32212_t:CDS:2, partial [Racocetra persica]